SVFGEGAAAPVARVDRQTVSSILSTLSAERMAVALALAITIWIAHFSQSFHFGLYEDDWAFIGQPIAWTWAHFLDWISMCFTAWAPGGPGGLPPGANGGDIWRGAGGVGIPFS